MSVFRCVLAAAVVTTGCWAAEQPTAEVSELTPEGALVGVSMNSTVGVLLDEVPASMRARVASSLIAKPASFWLERAKQQIRLARYRLVFREFFYGYGSGKKQLPLPPESQWNVVLVGTPARVVGAHDAVVVGYRLTSTLLTDKDSPVTTEKRLGKVGGTWDEPFVFPVDPELLFQRTGYACMDEEDFPYNTVDSEEVTTYYDQDCRVEHQLSNQACHQTELVTRSCIQALDDEVGKVETAIRFTRLAWDVALADQVREGEPHSLGADMEVFLEDFLVNRVEYKYFAPGSCELQEQCIGAPGWRRVLQFNSSDQNIGGSTLDIGAVDYYLSGETTLNDQYNIFNFHTCHQHYHFSQYGSFSYDHPDAPDTVKQGFCLQSTDRVGNHERSPLHNPYGGCGYQGVSAGWVDQYKIGLPCQWVDVTDIDTSGGPVSAPLTFTSNPNGFLCEGEPVLDADGHPVFEPTPFTTPTGETMWRPKCNFTPGWFDNNSHSYSASVPRPGEGYVTEPCTRGQLGPLRNCGWKRDRDLVTCVPGQQVSLSCTIKPGRAPQAVRVCERSRALGTGLACAERFALASFAVDGSANVTFTCPAARDAVEIGGQFALYTGPVYPSDSAAPVTCTAQ